MAHEGEIREMVARISELMGPPVDSPLVGNLWDRYVATLAGKAWVKQTGYMMRRVLSAWSSRTVDSLRVSDWSDLRDSESFRKLAPRTRNLMLGRVKTFFNWAVIEDRIRSNPLAKAKREKARPHRETTFADKDFDLFLRCADSRLRAFQILYTDSMMRSEEIRTLRWSAIDWKARKISIAWNETKGGRSGVARLTDRGIEALRAMPCLPDVPYVFANRRTKKPLHHVRFWQLFRKAADGILPAAPGDRRAHQHDGRHTGASKLLAKGVDIMKVSKLMRHASVRSTLPYLHVLNDADLDAAHALLERAPRKGPQRVPRREDETKSVTVQKQNA